MADGENGLTIATAGPAQCSPSVASSAMGFLVVPRCEAEQAALETPKDDGPRATVRPNGVVEVGKENQSGR